ncbi:MAG: pyridoxamine 5'-phosphate oxidase family protein [Anaerolineae bacterium]|nr:pyridoxamine 5'-phosphate oxidase family protein [Anaerolineae bacterium]
MSDFPQTKKNRVVRAPKRGKYDWETIYHILDEGLICHVGLVEAEQPVVIPTLYARDDDRLLLHGATTSRLIEYAQAGNPICVTVTLLDGIVLARSVFHHSMNYRSVVLFGQGHLVSDEEKMAGMKQFTERLIPGRWADARPPNAQEFKATSVVAIPIDLASAKVRSGPPIDDEEDLSLPVWAGVIPMRQQFLAPVRDPLLPGDIPLPDYINGYLKARQG